MNSTSNMPEGGFAFRRQALSPTEITAFHAWLLSHGAAIGRPTSEWELLRFRWRSRSGVVYINGKGKVSLVGIAQQLYYYFDRGLSPGELCK